MKNILENLIQKYLQNFKKIFPLAGVAPGQRVAVLCVVVPGPHRAGQHRVGALPPPPRRRQPRHPPCPARRHLQTCRREDMTTKFSTILPQLLPSETLYKEALTSFLAIHTLFRSQTSTDPEPLSVISLTQTIYC